MEPQIRYATTADGVKIAYRTLGAGLPLVDDWGIFSHLQLEWHAIRGGWRELAESLAAKYRYVRFDHRGSGLSERNVSDFSLDALVLDLEAVVDHLDLRTVALYGSAPDSAPAVISYAARHPQWVSHLIMWGASARGADSIWAAARSLREKDWDLYLETTVRAVFGWSIRQATRDVIDFYRGCVTPEVGRAAREAAERFDVTTLLRDIQCPTLVLDHASNPLRSADAARELASMIPGARLLLIEEDPFDTAGWVKVEAAIDEFLREGEAAPYPDGLTPREMEVLRLIAAGHTGREIGQELVLSVRTVARHITNIYRKIGARGKADAITYALRHRL